LRRILELLNPFQKTPTLARTCKLTDSDYTYRALVRAIGESLWRAGTQRKAVLVVLDVPGLDVEDVSREDEQDEVRYTLSWILEGHCLALGRF
jgi:hypothetical protein